MSDILIRPFAWADVPEITAIYGHYVAHTIANFDIDPPGETAMAQKFGAMVDQGHPVIVAEEGGKLIGYAYASTYRPRPAYRFTCENTVYLAPDATGKGLGDQLLGELIIRAQTFGFRQMLAVITAGNPASIRLHEKHGFRVVGTYAELGFKFDRWIDIVHMQKRL